MPTPRLLRLLAMSLINQPLNKLISDSIKHIVDQYGDIILQYKTKLIDKFRLLQKYNAPIWYPEVIKIVPNYKFTKVPMIKWSQIQLKDPNDPEVLAIKKETGRLGKLVNSAMILDRILIVDLDSDGGKETVAKLGKFFDWETRRGFHKFFVLKEGRIAMYKYGGRYVIGKTTIYIPELNAKLEIKSGPQFLSTYPFQSHYLVIDRQKNDIVIKRYNPVSTCAKKVVFANDISCAISTAQDIYEFVISILEESSNNLYKSFKNNFSIEFTEELKQVSIANSDSVPSQETKSLNMFGNLKYEEFKLLLESLYDRLPNCIKVAFFEHIGKGFGFAFALLAAKTFPLFVLPTEEETIKVAEDFAKRADSFKSAKLYYWYYYAYGAKPEKNKVGKPSAIDIPDEIYDLIYQRANCEYCAYSSKCKVYSYIKRNTKEGKSPRFLLLDIIKNV